MTPRRINPRREVVPVVALTTDEIIEDLADLARFGVGMIEAAHRVGKSVSACERFLYRHGQGDLVVALWALNRGQTLPVRERRRTARQHYGAIHGDWAQQTRADAAALMASLPDEDPELCAARRAALKEAS